MNLDAGKVQKAKMFLAFAAGMVFSVLFILSSFGIYYIKEKNWRGSEHDMKTNTSKDLPKHGQSGLVASNFFFTLNGFGFVFQTNRERIAKNEGFRLAIDKQKKELYMVFDGELEALLTEQHDRYLWSRTSSPEENILISVYATTPDQYEMKNLMVYSLNITDRNRIIYEFDELRKLKGQTVNQEGTADEK